MKDNPNCISVTFELNFEVREKVDKFLQYGLYYAKERKCHENIPVVSNQRSLKSNDIFILIRKSEMTQRQ